MTQLFFFSEMKFRRTENKFFFKMQIMEKSKFRQTFWNFIGPQLFLMLNLEKIQKFRWTTTFPVMKYQNISEISLDHNFSWGEIPKYLWNFVVSQLFLRAKSRKISEILSDHNFSWDKISKKCRNFRTTTFPENLKFWNFVGPHDLHLPNAWPFVLYFNRTEGQIFIQNARFVPLTRVNERMENKIWG